jgi:glutaredoxin domain-containing cysteine-rich protein 1
MTIKTLKARILRALKSSLPAAGGADGAAPPSARQYHGDDDVDALSDDASFFDAREPETPTKAHRRRRPSAEPLDAWELVDPDQDQEDARASPDPLLGFPRGGGGSGSGSGVVLYTTTLRGVRRTFEDCNGVRALLEGLGARFQERDVSMDRGLRDQLWAAAGERAVPPRLFVRGRDLGGAARVLALHEEGRLAPLLPLAPAPAPAPVTRGGGTARLRCGACAGLGFVVCGACDGSRKALQLQGGRCQGCNENGLVMCALCS